MGGVVIELVVAVLVGLVVVACVLVVLCRRRVPVEPAPLESGEAREAIRAAIERRSPR